MDLYFLLSVFSGLLAISSLYINSNTNGAYVAKRLRKYEGVIGLALLLSSLGVFVRTVTSFHAGAWLIINLLFTLLASLACLGLGGVFILTFFQPSPDAPATSPIAPAPPAVPPALASDAVPPMPGETVPPAIPPAPPAIPGVPPALASNASALAALKLPLGFAVLGLAFLVFIFSSIRVY